MSRTIQLTLWGTTIGYLSYTPGHTLHATFEYDQTFMQSDIRISPLKMPCPPAQCTFQRLSYSTFHGVLGCIADSLPDSFGKRLIDIYLTELGIPVHQITALDRLLYVADRGIGALEYLPAESLPLQPAVPKSIFPAHVCCRCRVRSIF